MVHILCCEYVSPCKNMGTFPSWLKLHILLSVTVYNGVIVYFCTGGTGRACCTTWDMTSWLGWTCPTPSVQSSQQ